MLGSGRRSGCVMRRNVCERSWMRVESGSHVGHLSARGIQNQLSPKFARAGTWGRTRSKLGTVGQLPHNHLTPPPPPRSAAIVLPQWAHRALCDAAAK